MVGKPFTVDVEQDIRNWLADALEDGSVEALGSWDGDELAAVVVFSRLGWVWKIRQLATDVRYRHRKQALRLKLAVNEMAAAAGAQAVISWVHIENGAMRQLNAKLGVVEGEVDDTGCFIQCTMPVAHAPRR